MPESKGYLKPGSPEVAFERFALGEELSELVRHIWVVHWAVPPGEVSSQRVLTYPAFNAVIDPCAAEFHGPDPRLQVGEPFAEPGTDLSRLAAELGYTDYAHFSRQYRRVLGESPRATRDGAVAAGYLRGQR